MISLLLPSLLTSNITPDHATRGASKHLEHSLDYLESEPELVVPEGGEESSLLAGMSYYCPQIFPETGGP